MTRSDVLKKTHKMKTLHLNLKKKWFDMILLGEKVEEYREIKLYWWRILGRKNIGWDLPSHEIDMIVNGKPLFEKFDTVTFSNGYSKNRPQFVIELKNIDIKQGNPKWGAIPGVDYFVLTLGKIKHVRK